MITGDLTILGRNSLTISGNDQSRALLIDSGVTVNLSGTTITRGYASATAVAGGFGGGISNNAGALTVSNSAISGNSADYGGGVSNNNGFTLTVTNSTISGNSASYGGGVYNPIFGGPLTVTNSTISGNYADQYGGGVYNDYSGGQTTIASSTITANTVNPIGGVGGGILTSTFGVLTLNNTIVAGNHGGLDVDGVVAAASAHNLIGGAMSWSNLVDGVNGNLVGVADPLLGPLADNGGPTLTHAILPGSPAYNGGDNSLLPGGLATDQRGGGFSRVRDGVVDIGAFEVPNNAPSLVASLGSITINEGSLAGNAIGIFDDQGDAALQPATLTASLGGLNLSSFPLVGWSYVAPDGPLSTTVTISIADSYGAVGSLTFNLVVNNVAPTIAISGAGNANVGETYTLNLGAVTDPGEDTVSQYIVHWGDGASDTYTAAGAQTHVYAEPGSYAITVDLVDEDGSYTNHANPLSVLVAEVSNHAPTDIALSNADIFENALIGSVVGAFSTTDPDAGDHFTYAIIPIAGGHGHEAFAINGDKLVTAASLDFETQANYTIHVRSTDAGGLSTDKDFVITVDNANEAPTDIALSNALVDEDAAIGAVVGVFSTTDPDAGDTFAYTIIPIDGGNGHEVFAISGNQLVTTATLDFETQASYTIRVWSTDAGGLSVEEDFVITVNQMAAPLELTAFQVSDGLAQRSYIRNLALTFNNPSAIAGLITGGRVKLTRFGLDGGGPGVAVPLAGALSAVGDQLRFDFGEQGIGGNRNTNQGDGYYRIALDLDGDGDGDGSFETVRYFYRLFGDVNGDRKVDATDFALILSEFGAPVGSLLLYDVNGDGVVNALDRTLAIRSNGRSLDAGLTLDS